MKKTIFNILAIFIIGIAGGIFANQVLWPYLVERPVNIIEREEIIIQENTALKNAIEKVEKTVVGIKTTTKDAIFNGSGLILTSDGLIVTLADLIPQGAVSEFFIDGQPVEFQVLRRDANYNLALVKVEKDNLPTVDFALYEKVKIGERVFLMGSLFEQKEVKKEVNEGIIKYIDEDFIRTNIFERVSLIGSPLFNIKGEFLGLVITDSWSRVSAIPVTKIKTFAGF
jgi:S1-C subfamily serine protease